VATFGPCSVWDVRWPCDVSTESPTATGYAVQVATDAIWALSGRRFGTCSVTLRPCREDCGGCGASASWYEWPLASSWVTPALIGGLWFNVVCGVCPGTCSCSEVSEVLLPAPVSSITAVVIDGVTLATSAYELRDNRRLVRIDGNKWPRCNDLSLAAGQVNTWTVQAVYGEDVPEGGKWAVGELACELLRAFRGDECRLPKTVTQLVRQGVTITMPELTSIFENGTTGLYLADAFIQTWNPSHLRRRARTYSVDAPAFPRLT